MKPTLLALILAAISTSVTSAAPIPQDPINDLVSRATTAQSGPQVKKSVAQESAS
jgi:hypothetical protein